jgi:hypothetical protein
MPERNGVDAEGPSSKVAVAHSLNYFIVHCNILVTFTVQLILSIERTFEI